MLKRRWNERTPGQVGELIGKGSAVVADHRVLTHRSVCLEISQVNRPHLQERSASRLQLYGYDSTSLYLWGLLAMQEFMLTHYNRELSKLLDRAHEFVDAHSSRQALKQFLQLKTKIYRMLDDSVWVTSDMKEQRHVKFFTEAARIRGLKEILAEIDHKLNDLNSIATGVHQVFLTMDQRDILDDLRAINRGTAETKRSIGFLNLLAAFSPAAILSEYLSRLHLVFEGPWRRVSTLLGFWLLFVLVFQGLQGGWRWFRRKKES